MNRTLAVAGIITVLIVTATMLFTADVYLWEYPPWAWGMIWVAGLGLCINAVVKPEKAHSIPAIVVGSIVGLALTWPVTVGGTDWWPVWLALGVAMPLLGCWLLKSFSLAYRQT